MVLKNWDPRPIYLYMIGLNIFFIKMSTLSERLMENIKRSGTGTNLELIKHYFNNLKNALAGVSF